MDYIHINKQIRTPIYRQIVNSISDAVHTNVLKHNDHLPTEEELCSSFNISNIVVKQAYKELVDDGIVKRIRGKGTYVHSIHQEKMHFKHFNQFEHHFIQKGVIKKRILLEDAILTTKELSLINPSKNAPYVRLTFVASLNSTPIYVIKCLVQKSYSRYFIETDDLIFNTQEWLHKNPQTKIRHEFMVDSLTQSNAYLLNKIIGEASHLIQSSYRIEEELIALTTIVIPNEFLHFEYTVGQTE